jgi:hypothetical protein
MSNNFYVYNVDSPAAVIGGDVQESLESVRAVQIVEAPYRIPLSWLFAIDIQHLCLIKVKYLDASSQHLSIFHVLAPVLSVEEAISIFLSRHDLFLQTLNDLEIAEGYFQYMLHELRSLDLPYLAMDPHEIIESEDEKKPSDELSDALKQSDLELQMSLCGFTKGVLPYSVSDLYKKRPEELPDSVRMENAVSVDPNFIPLEYRKEEVLVPLSAPVSKKWWKFW